MNHRNRTSTIVGRFLSAAFLLAAPGCDQSPEGKAERTAERVAALRAGTEGEQAGARRCGDFLSEAEASQLGIEGYRPGKGDTNRLRGVVCTTHPVVVTVFMAEQYPTMIRGAKALTGWKETTGPSLGKETFWFEALEAQQVMFISKKGDYAFGVSGEKKALVEKAARLASEGR
jgi:hypothetical protein